MADASTTLDEETQRTRRRLIREVEVLLAAVDAAASDLVAARSPQVRRLLDAALRARTALEA